MLAEAERLVQAGVLRDKEDIFYLRFQELQEVVRTQQVDGRIVRRRKDELRWYQALTPPRVLTSDGEAVAGSYRRDDLPAGALAGLPVSAGTVEGRARVVLDMAEAGLEPGDILVTAYGHPPDPGRAADPRAGHGRVRRDPELARRSRCPHRAPAARPRSAGFRPSKRRLQPHPPGCYGRLVAVL